MAISKTKIKKYIEFIEKEIKKVEKKQKQATKLEDGDTLRNLYLEEEHLKGELEACNYILNNC